LNKIILVKKISLGVLGCLAALVFGYFFANFIAVPETGSFVAVFLSSAIFLSVFLLQVTLATDLWLSPLFIVIEMIGISLFFLGSFSIVLLIGIIIGIGFLIAANYSGVSEVKNNLEIHFYRNSRIVMAFATMALALFASFAYVGSFDLKDPAAARKNLEVILRPTEPLVSRYVPNFSSLSTIKEIAAAILPAELKLAPADQRAEAIFQISTRLAESFSGFAGIPVIPNDRIIDIAYRATIGRILGLSPLAQTSVLVGLGVLFFFFIKFILFFVDLAAVGLSYGFYHLLKAFGFFRIEMQNVAKRVIVLE